MHIHLYGNVDEYNANVGDRTVCIWVTLNSDLVEKSEALYPGPSDCTHWT